MSCLKVKNAIGETVLELDDQGNPVTVHEALSYENHVPERLVAAAAGGTDITKLPPGLKVIYCDDVELINHGGKWGKKGPWLILRIPDQAYTALSTLKPDELRARLMSEQSTLRAVIYEADLVHEEQEPEPELRYMVEARLLRESGFDTVLQHTQGTTIDELVETLGYDELERVPPVAVYLWAADNGVADHLPECYLGITVTEELP